MQRARNLFTQNKIAIIWDFDKTLIPYDMQRPLFRYYGIDEPTFWRESNALPEYYRTLGYELVAEQMYLRHIVTYVKAGRFKGLNNALLRQLGGELTFYPGLPDFFPALQQQVASRPEYRAHDIAVEHYIVSSGLRQMILGSAIAPYLDGVWACELAGGEVPGPGFLDRQPHPASAEHDEISGVLYAIDDTTKTRAIFEINKGSNWHPQISVNAAMTHDDRRVPFENMIYVADGPSDVPVFSVVNQQGGKTLGVYTPGSAAAYAKADHLQRQGRVQAVSPADYTPGSQAYLWLSAAVDEIARRMLTTQHANIERRVGLPPSYRPASPTGDLADRLGRRLPGTSLAPEEPAAAPLTPAANGVADDLGAAGFPNGPSDDRVEASDPPSEFLAPEDDPVPNGVQLKIDDLAADDDEVPLFHLPAPVTAFEPHPGDPQDALLAIVSEISADTHRPISPDELRALRAYVSVRVSARSPGSRRTGSHRDVAQIERAEIESQLEAIRRRGH